MAETVRVELGSRSYAIDIGRDLPMGGVLSARGARTGLIVSDSNVDALYGDRCAAQLEARGMTVSRTVIPAGEGSKSLDCLRRLYDQALAAGLDRRSFIVALGGGVVGDLAGFAAASFLRGICLVQVPTSLLAMVDSSVGGKTGINLPQGKNLVGAFYQPVDVTVDLDTLATLPDREYASGMAEVVKYGVIWDAEFFAQLEADAAALFRRDLDVLAPVVARCCRIKAEVVATDERESGRRAILNFGHTLAHALEVVDGYGTWLHGEAVALGMVYASKLSVMHVGLDGADHGRLVNLLRALGLPVRRRRDPLSWPAVRTVMATDKKSVGRVPRFVLATRLGRVVRDCEVDEGRLAETLGELD